VLFLEANGAVAKVSSSLKHEMTDKKIENLDQRSADLFAIMFETLSQFH
jgi:hypothetical protein